MFSFLDNFNVIVKMKSHRLFFQTLASLACITFLTMKADCQWSQTNLQNSSGVRSLAVNRDTIFAGTTNEGVFKTVDGGMNWFSVNNGIPSLSYPVDALAIKGSDVYAGLDAGGVYKTTNWGSSWFAVNNGLTIYYMHALVVNGSELFAVSDNAVFRSTNDALSWTPILQNTLNYNCLAVSGNSICVGSSSAGIYRTTNGGANWNTANNGLGYGGGVYALAASGSDMFAGAFHRGVYKSTDGGANWVQSYQEDYVRAFHVSGNSLYSAGNGGFFKTTNNGITWLRWEHGFQSFTACSIVSSEDYLYAGGYYSVWKRSKLPTLNLKINLEACSPNADTVKVYLRHSAAPYEFADSAKGFLASSGDLWVNFPNVEHSVNYYIVVKHRNSLETWSKTGGEAFVSGFLAYDFTSAQSQAYGNNLTLCGDKYSIYTGDVNFDGFVDGSDVMLISNDAYAFLSGYVTSDLNGDSLVDATDLAYADNNTFRYVALIRP
jgi:photosystem II stability/assembly factor-like uncharacterized protein